LDIIRTKEKAIDPPAHLGALEHRAGGEMNALEMESLLGMDYVGHFGEVKGVGVGKKKRNGEVKGEGNWEEKSEGGKIEGKMLRRRGG
jgi:hypothetical protein